MKNKTKIIILIITAVIILLTVSSIAFSLYSPDIHLSINNETVDNINASLIEENGAIKIHLYQNLGLEDEILNEFSFELFNIDCNIRNGK